MIVDFHTHVFSPVVRENRGRYAGNDRCFALLYSRKEAVLATAEELVASMDREGIDISVILNLGWSTHELCVETNDYIMESIARYPQRLVGFGAVQPHSPKAAAEIERCARGGIRGIGELRPDTQQLDFSDASVMAPFAGALLEHRLPLLLHTSEPVGHHYPGKGGVTPDRLEPLFARYPELTVVCSHWGGGLPFYALMPEVKRALQNVYFDTAASPFLYSPQVYRQVSQLVGADRILFGSDYPLLKPGRLLREIDSSGLTAAEKELVLSQNARRLLNLQ